MYTVGYIDVEKYKMLSTNIQTSEVIITEERIRHIQERHSEDYERFCGYIPQMLQEPDYIIESNQSNTAVILKEILENGEKFKLILRLKTPDMPADYKNSVISFWDIGNTTWRKTLKNKKILYKRE